MNILRPDLMYVILQVFGHFLINQVPTEWRRRGFASLKSLGSWMKDLRWRIRFFGLWLERGNPYAFSLPAFFFPKVGVGVLDVRESRKVHACRTNSYPR